jgi:SOS-response transcriptional repressor LexA
MPTIQKTRKMFVFVSVYVETYRRAPTLRRIADEFGLRSTGGVHRHLNTMKSLGWIKRAPYDRNIQVIKEERKAA